MKTKEIEDRFEICRAKTTTTYNPPEMAFGPSDAQWFVAYALMGLLRAAKRDGVLKDEDDE